MRFSHNSIRLLVQAPNVSWRNSQPESGRNRNVFRILGPRDACRPVLLACGTCHNMSVATESYSQTSQACNDSVATLLRNLRPQLSVSGTADSRATSSRSASEGGRLSIKLLPPGGAAGFALVLSDLAGTKMFLGQQERAAIRPAAAAPFPPSPPSSSPPFPRSPPPPSPPAPKFFRSASKGAETDAGCKLLSRCAVNLHTASCSGFRVVLQTGQRQRR